MHACAFTARLLGPSNRGSLYRSGQQVTTCGNTFAYPTTRSRSVSGGSGHLRAPCGSAATWPGHASHVLCRTRCSSKVCPHRLWQDLETVETSYKGSSPAKQAVYVLSEPAGSRLACHDRHCRQRAISFAEWRPRGGPQNLICDPVIADSRLHRIWSDPLRVDRRVRPN